MSEQRIREQPAAAGDSDDNSQQHHHQKDAVSAYMDSNPPVVILKRITLSSLQIIVLVVAGTCGFIVSLFALVLPQAIRKKITSTSTSSPSSSSSSSHANRSRHPRRRDVAPRSPSSSSSAALPRAWPMTRGDSTNSTSTTSTLLSLSSSIHSTSTASSSTSPLSDTQSLVHVARDGDDDTSASASGSNTSPALLEHLAKDAPQSRATNCNRSGSPSSSSSCTSSSTSSGCPSPTTRRSMDDACARVSRPRSPISLVIPRVRCPSKRSASGSSTPTASDHASSTSTSMDKLAPASRSSTVPDIAASASASGNGNSGSRPPILSRIFSFTSTHSTSSSSTASSSTSTSASSSSSRSNSTMAPRPFPSSSAACSSSSTGGDDGSTTETTAVAATKTKMSRRLSTRIAAGFRSAVNSKAGAASSNSSSRRALSETEASLSLDRSNSLASLVAGQTNNADDDLTPLASPPVTPRMVSGPIFGGSTSTTPTPTAVKTASSPIKSPSKRPSISNRRAASETYVQSQSTSTTSMPPVRMDRHAVMQAVRKGSHPPSSTSSSLHSMNERNALPKIDTSRADTVNSASIAVPASPLKPKQQPQSMTVTMSSKVAPLTKQQQDQMQKAFVPFKPFSDEDYRKSSLDLSGTSQLTMSAHFANAS